ncbi:hypothetical protein FZC84_21060 [Rossellomorea vietnamensis]|uniref:Transposase n=1 Tax=Rossellomorea vietnamensis TaxID=218284 RepID=A0A5D4M347_9BACI|nr:hypothetical protein [Rossellomorea vietnamensis]TYR95921.1 hypothetical protein FZC84_21060 [Rossellomorea vietnamensis]
MGCFFWFVARDTGSQQVPRTSRFEIIYKLAAKTASETAQSIIHVLKNLPKKVVKSITADRGKEFEGHRDRFRVPLKNSLY